VITRLRAVSLWVGADFAFGYQREGNIEFLSAQAQQRGFDLRIVDLMDGGNGERVSSTRIRTALGEGNVEIATQLLGRPHQITGKVTTGAGRGRTIGIPTANLEVVEELAAPARGVYAAYAIIESQRIPAVVNIGVRPTFDGQAKQTIEAHLLDFTGNLYDLDVSLDFVSRLRSEQKFDSVNDLVAQIHHDIELGREILTPEG
jgi:riboflavin kinase / FMN adenylyltransferase